jgi:hypothetical protein
LRRITRLSLRIDPRGLAQAILICRISGWPSPGWPLK